MKKNLFQLLLAFAVLFAFTSCEKDEVCDGKTCSEGQTLNVTTCECEITTAGEVVVSENISGEVTWTADKVYVLSGRITVVSGACLTIEPGTIIKGKSGAAANATALLVARGAKIMAEGTEAKPIIFTSEADQIQPGQIVSPNLDDTDNGLWGGVIILGYAPISADAEAVQIEGIPPADQNGLYGGNDPEDNSGILKYVSIRHGGADIGEGNEINGLTLGGVGSKTVIDNVEVVANVDDGIEWFGGTVNATNCIVWGQGDDGFDCDQAWTGTLDNFIYVAGANSDHALELDGPEGSRDGKFTLKNGSLKGGKGEFCDLRSKVAVNLDNLYFFGFDKDADLEFDNNGVSQRYLDGDIILKNIGFNVSHLDAGNVTIEKIVVEKVATDENDNPIENKLDIFSKKPLDASVKVTATKSGGANIAPFKNWTLADKRGNLNDF